MHWTGTCLFGISLGCRDIKETPDNLVDSSAWATSAVFSRKSPGNWQDARVEMAV
jgi:hypothetical protein